MKNILRLTLLPILSLVTMSSSGQDLTNNRFGKGISVVARDSSFTLKFSTRFQTLYQLETDLETHDYEDGLQIRRARVKFDGHVYDPRLVYKIELAIANADISSGSIPQSGRTANIVLDAVAKWNFYGDWSLWFGQTKLPGNRERVISSQALQFVDRSNVNSRFNLDRDLGIQLHLNKTFFNLAMALSMGEGRNITSGNTGGYGYTTRFEYLPFGSFTDKGDYFSSDLRREATPKLSIGLTYDYNDRATRSRGQLGDFVGVQRDLSTFFADAHFKFRGFSSLVEYAKRTSPDGAAFFDEETLENSSFFAGSGISIQGGYLFNNNVELAGRYTTITPSDEVPGATNEQYTFGISRYFVGHSLKVQTDVTFEQEKGENDVLMYRLQLEVAF